MATSSHDELNSSFEAVDWDLWLQNDHVASVDENYFHPDFDSPSWHMGIDEPPGDPLLEAASQDALGTEGLGLDTFSSNTQSMETSGANFDWEDFLPQEDTELNMSKKDQSLKMHPSSAATSSSSNRLAPAPASQNPHSPARLGSLACDWPSCTRTLPTKSTYNRHYKNHTRPFKCPTCGARRATKCHLMRHMNERHYAADKFYCHVMGCERSRKYFPRKDNLRRHMKQIHCLVT